MRAKELYNVDAQGLQRKLRADYRYADGKFYYVGDNSLMKCTTTTTGKVRVRIFMGVLELAPLVWVYHHGRWPEGGIHFINSIRDDCRIENLAEKRKVQKHSHVERVAPRDRGVNNAPRNSTTGALGVHTVMTHKGVKYKAILRREGRQIVVGTFTDANAAAQAWQIVRDAYNDHKMEGAKAAAKRLKFETVNKKWMASREVLNELRDNPYHQQK